MRVFAYLGIIAISAIGAECCFGGGGAKPQPVEEPKVLASRPGPPPVEEAMVANTVNQNLNAYPGGGGNYGARQNSVTSGQLRDISEKLLSEDVNNVAQYVRVKHQGKTTSVATDDKAQGPLFIEVAPEALAGPTIKAMLALLDNYIPKVEDKEISNDIEDKEKNDFLDAIMKTKIMATTEQFLKSKHLIKRPLRTVLNEIWFDLYGRSGRNPGSSGFEHVFIGELKHGKVSGFHSWVSFIHEERDNDIDYKGFMKYLLLGDKGQILNSRFVWLNNNKPVTSMFIGTSPELEMALYTICFYARPSKKCHIQLNNKKVMIQTYPYKVGHKNLIGSAFPQI